MRIGLRWPASAMFIAVLLGMARAESPPTPQSIIEATITNENAAAARHDHYLYLTYERSDRTGGRLWEERVVDTDAGRLRLLLAEDGKPISAERHMQELDRLNAIAADPAAFARRQSSVLNEEKRAREMLEELPHDFLFDDVVLEKGIWTMNFRPNPGYTPSGIEERVLHNMAGRLVIDARDLRMIHMDFHLTQDVSIGFGLLANIHAGTNFISDHQIADGHWHTVHVATQVRARAMLVKSLNLNLDLVRTDFVSLDRSLTIPQAVALLEK